MLLILQLFPYEQPLEEIGIPHALVVESRKYETPKAFEGSTRGRFET
jgi:hypothetical protein